MQKLIHGIELDPEAVQHDRCHVRGGIGWIPLWGGNGVRTWAMVDEQDLARLAGYRYFLSSLGYPLRHARKSGRQVDQTLGRDVLGIPVGAKGPRVSFVSRDTLDCRRANLSIPGEWVRRWAIADPEISRVALRMSPSLRG